MTARRGTPPAPPNPARRCALYTRKSTTIGLERDFNSLDAQREACQGYIRSRAHAGWEIAETYEDGGFTGATLDRPAFQRLLRDIESGKVDVVVVYKVDRLSRSLLDFSRVMEQFNRAGVAFVSVTQNFSTADAMGRLTLNMLMSFAEFEREMIAERTRDKIVAARRKGRWTGGAVPLGYDVCDKRLVVNELEAVVVREIFALYAEHGSVLAVAQELNARGHATKHHRAHNGRVRAARPWSKDTVLRVLRNPVYAGFILCKGERFPATHVALIAPAQFEAAATLLAAHTDRGHRLHDTSYLLRGLLFCAACGGALTPATARKGDREYRYYRCVSRDKHGRDACPTRPLPATPIEEFALERLRAIATTPDFAHDITHRMQERLLERRGHLETERRELPPRIAALSVEGNKLVEAASDQGAGGQALLHRRMEEVAAELTRLEARLTEVDRQLTVLGAAEITAAWVGSALHDFEPVWEVMTPANRERLLRSVIQRIDVDEVCGDVRMTLTDISPTTPPTSPSSQETAA